MTQTAAILDLADLVRLPLVGAALTVALLLAFRSLGLQGPRQPALRPVRVRRCRP